MPPSNTTAPWRRPRTRVTGRPSPRSPRSRTRPPRPGQPVSLRADESGWTTQAISAPRGLAIIGITGRGRFKGFTPDLCTGWFLQDSNLTLTPDAPVGYPEAYRRSNCSDPFSYQALAAAVPQGFPANSFNDPSFSDYVEPLGSSVDGRFSVFRAPTPLTGDACKSWGSSRPTRGVLKAVRLISVLPNGKGSCTHSSCGYLLRTLSTKSTRPAPFTQCQMTARPSTGQKTETRTPCITGSRPR